MYVCIKTLQTHRNLVGQGIGRGYEKDIYMGRKK